MSEAIIGNEKEAAITAIANRYVAFARNHPGTYEATIRTPDQGDGEYKYAAEEVVKLILNVIYEFGLEDDDAIHAVRGLRSLLHGFASIEQKGGFGMPIDLDGTLQFIVNTFLARTCEKYRLI
ncbi:TetR-like C-terminal domain-containing protein [Bacillus sp. T3]|uniref:TetR-like C-terminal domain-containing protein n=1 Tax=Bacillus sp. T3 TaxID=467262 RepID=UPI0029824883|nr:TetR-like C-terminal domain-containing protein [Bacillus sp. T3]